MKEKHMETTILILIAAMIAIASTTGGYFLRKEMESTTPSEGDSGKKDHGAWQETESWSGTIENSVESLGKEHPGVLWLSVSDKPVTVGENISTKVYLNTGSQKLGAYKFAISYDPSVIEINEKIGESGVELGADATEDTPEEYLEAVIANVMLSDDNISVQGLTPYGIGPGEEIHLMTINWTVEGEVGDNTTLKWNIKNLVDETTKTIGTPTGTPEEILIEE